MASRGCGYGGERGCVGAGGDGIRSVAGTLARFPQPGTSGRVPRSAALVRASQSRSDLAAYGPWRDDRVGRLECFRFHAQEVARDGRGDTAGDGKQAPEGHRVVRSGSRLRPATHPVPSYVNLVDLQENEYGQHGIW